MVFEKQIVIDGRGHLLGRLASIVAKEILSGSIFELAFILMCLLGQKVVVVRTEEINISGSFFRNKRTSSTFLHYLFTLEYSQVPCFPPQEGQHKPQAWPLPLARSQVSTNFLWIFFSDFCIAASSGVLFVA